jgi:hypothetical protein
MSEPAQPPQPPPQLSNQNNLFSQDNVTEFLSNNSTLTFSLGIISNKKYSEITDLLNKPNKSQKEYFQLAQYLVLVFADGKKGIKVNKQITIINNDLNNDFIRVISENIISGLNTFKINQPQNGGKKSKKDKDRKKVRGGAVPDLVNDVAAFQNTGGLLATASPLENAQQMIPALYNAGSFNAGLHMPTSGQGLPGSYNLVTNPQTAGPSAQSGGKAKKNRDKDDKKKHK